MEHRGRIRGRRFGVYDNLVAVLANALGSQKRRVPDVFAYAMFANGASRVQPLP